MLRMLTEYLQVAGSQPLKVTFIIVIMAHLLDYVLGCARYPAEISIYIALSPAPAKNSLQPVQFPAAVFC